MPEAGIDWPLISADGGSRSAEENQVSAGLLLTVAPPVF